MIAPPVGAEVENRGERGCDRVSDMVGYLNNLPGKTIERLFRILRENRRGFRVVPILKRRWPQ